MSDSNLAAMSGFYSFPDKCWWARAIEAAGISAAQLGLVVETGRPVPTRPETRPPGYSDSLEIVFAGSDHTAGAIGCGCRKGLSVMTLGTAGVYYRWAGLDLGEDSRSKDARGLLPEPAKTGALECRYQLWRKYAARR